MRTDVNVTGPGGQPRPCRIIVGVSAELSRVPIERRRRASALLAGLAVLLVVVGVLPWLSPSTLAVRVLAVAVLVAAALVGLVAWGLLHSVALDRQRAAESDLDAVLVETATAAGQSGCACGHDHEDPSELHITDLECEGSTAASPSCPHTCESCVLATLRS
jgi:hypothetical protein